MTRAEAYADLFVLFCGKLPPIELPEDNELCELRQLDERAYERLQDFVATHLRLQWLTGIGVLEAMDTLVHEAIANGELAFERARPALVTRVPAPKETKPARVCKRCGNAIRARGRDVQMCPLADGDICEPRRKK